MLYNSRRYTVRPQSNPFCNAGVISFCPTGEPDNIMPEFNPGDAIEIYALKKPVWQFKFGDVLGKLVSKITWHNLSHEYKVYQEMKYQR